jgi:hypothetical protein
VNEPKFAVEFATKQVAGRAGPVKVVIPLGFTFTEYDLQLSLTLGGKSYFKDTGRPIGEYSIIYICYI